MTRDRGTLQAWYRQAMLRRIAELAALRSGVRAGESGALDEVRAIGQALRGSGATFGFPKLSAAAGIVESAEDREVIRRLEGLVWMLGRLTADESGERPRPVWVAHAADMPEALVGESSDGRLHDAWTEVSSQAGLDPFELATRVARYFDLSVADFDEARESGMSGALRLVTEAAVTELRFVPLEEDAETFVAATADPTSLELEIELQRLTGRRAVLRVAPPDAVDDEIARVFDRTRVPAPRDQGRPAPSHIVDEIEREEAEADDPSLLFTSTGPIAGAPAPAPSPRRDTRKILVVDDDASARVLVRSLLEQEGWSVLEAGDGVEALTVLREHGAPALVVADLNMPDMDGLELLWALRDEKAWSDVPVIVVTGERDGMLETQLLEEGADDYVRKPIDPRLFMARLESTVRRRVE